MKYNIKIKPLTEKQKQVLLFIQKYIESESFPPIVREIAAYFKISSKAADDHLSAIIKKGYIKRKANCSRGLVVMKRITNNYRTRNLKPFSKAWPKASFS